MTISILDKQMSDFPVESGENGDNMAAVMESFQKKNAVRPQVTSTSAAQMLQQANSTSSRVAKSSCSSTTSSSSQRVHVTSSSEMKASSMKSDLSELKSSISEMKNLSNATAFVSSRLRSSMEELDRDDGSVVGCVSGGSSPDMTEPLVTFPDPDTPPPVTGTVCLTNPSATSIATSASSSSETVKFEQKRVTSASKTKVVTDGFSSEQAMANSTEMKRVQTGEMSYQEQSAAAAVRARVEMDGVSAEKSLALKQQVRSIKMSRQGAPWPVRRGLYRNTIWWDRGKNKTKQQDKLEQRSLKAGEITQQECQNMAASSMKVQSETFTAEKKAMAAQQQRQTVTSTGIFNHEKHMAASSQSNITITSKGMCKSSTISSASQMRELMNGTIKAAEDEGFEDLERLSANSNPQEVECAIHKYSMCLDAYIKSLKRTANGMEPRITKVPQVLNRINEMMRKAWAVPTHGHTLDHSRTGTGILEHLFKHSEGTCSDVIRLGGLDAVLFECRKNDVETLRHCAGALANLSLYGGAENQEAMIKRKVPMWLFPLAFHNDDNIKYYACLAIAVLVANKEIEAAVLKSGTLDLVEPFVTSHNPSDFAKSNLAHAHGQSKNWLQRLVPVLSSKREEARNLAAFHFCMEAGIKKQQGKTDIFGEIGAIEPLKKVASCPNAVASKYAAQALRLIGEEVPHKLSQQVPLWSSEDVREWVKQIGFSEYANNFVDSRVDGDLLLQLTEENLRDDIGITNGIRRRRFTRELQNLKKMADYSSRDTGNLNVFLQNIGAEYSIYTYSMLNAGVDKDSIRNLTEDQLLKECGITNSIHRHRIFDHIKDLENGLSNSSEENLDKSLDVFVSYRRSNGSQLASLLKVHLHLRTFSVFIDVERLEAGKFDNNLLQSIRQARHFLLVLTPNALDRCIGDVECKDWVHREIVAALQSNCNIIPIIDNFQWPEPEELPEDMRAVCHFNGVRWIHDYQDACVDKLERFMRGELNVRSDGPSGRVALKGDATPGTPSGNTLSRQPPSYQRMHSNESGKGSDKDVNGNSGGGRD
ncbi:Sterile alpha and TIR motif-containing protein 1 [Blattella germanica]|nr:Sterile alpha and TIR motif-containing protein 1 [Blattella germanica]